MIGFLIGEMAFEEERLAPFQATPNGYCLLKPPLKRG